MGTSRLLWPGHKERPKEVSKGDKEVSKPPRTWRTLQGSGLAQDLSGTPPTPPVLDPSKPLPPASSTTLPRSRVPPTPLGRSVPSFKARTSSVMMFANPEVRPPSRPPYSCPRLGVVSVTLYSSFASQTPGTAEYAAGPARGHRVPSLPLRPATERPGHDPDVRPLPRTRPSSEGRKGGGCENCWGSTEMPRDVL